MGLIREFERQDKLDAVIVRRDLRSGLIISESIIYLSGIVISLLAPWRLPLLLSSSLSSRAEVIWASARLASSMFSDWFTDCSTSFWSDYSLVLHLLIGNSF